LQQQASPCSLWHRPTCSQNALLLSHLKPGCVQRRLIHQVRAQRVHPPTTTETLLLSDGPHLEARIGEVAISSSSPGVSVCAPLAAGRRNGQKGAIGQNRLSETRQ